MPVVDRRVLSIQPSSVPVPQVSFATLGADGSIQPAVLNGFSFFGELGGYPANPADGDVAVGLWWEQDPRTRPEDVNAWPHFRMTDDAWLAKLEAHGVNLVRVFVLPLVTRDMVDAVSAFHVVTTGTGWKVDLTRPSDTFLDRVEDFVAAARARGIVVCLSFFSQYILRAKSAGFNPFSAQHNTQGLGMNIDNFCAIAHADDSTAFDQLTEPQKRYRVQRTLVTAIVRRTVGYWNVYYEPCNEPFLTGQGAMAGVAPWMATVAGWIHGITGGARMCEANAYIDDRQTFLDTVDPVTGNTLAQMIQVFSIHGKGWGGYAKADNPDVVTESNIIEGYDHDKWPGIRDAYAWGKSKGLAVVLDGDAHYASQEWASLFQRVTVAEKGTFCYRWDGRGNKDETLGTILNRLVGTGRTGITTLAKVPHHRPPDAPTVACANSSELLLRVTWPAQFPTARYAWFFRETDGSGNVLGAPIASAALTTEGPYERASLQGLSGLGGAYVVVGAALDGGFTTRLSKAVRLPNPLPAAMLSGEILEIDGVGTMPTRRGLSASVRVRNSGTVPWRGRQDWDADGHHRATHGVYARGTSVTGGLALMFFPLNLANAGEAQPIVLPGEVRTIRLAQVQRTRWVAGKLFGGLAAPLLPYTRQPFAFELSMGSLAMTWSPGVDPDVQPPIQADYGGFGTKYTELPAGRPLRIGVVAPARTAQKSSQDAVLGDAALRVPVTLGTDATLWLASVTTTGKGAPGAVIRAEAHLVGTRQELVVTHTGAKGVTVRVHLAAPDDEDLYYAGPHADPKWNGLAVPAAPKCTSVSLDRFSGKMAASSAYATKGLANGAEITWAHASNPTGIESVVARSTAAGADIVTRTVHVWEDVSADPREKTGTVSLAPGAVDRSMVLGAASAEQYHVPHVSGGTGAVARVVLVADAAGVFQRRLEIDGAGLAAAAVVTARVLEVVIEG